MDLGGYISCFYEWLCMLIVIIGFDDLVVGKIILFVMWMMWVWINGIILCYCSEVNNW